MTCADEGVAMRVLGVDLARRIAVCAESDGELVVPDGGAIRGAGAPAGRAEVAIDFVEPVAVGQELLVHAGVALANLGHAPPALARRGGR
jgi:hypothetical protein